MSVVTPDGSSLHAPHSSVAAPGFPADSDYSQDEQHAWVYDPSMDTLGTVNQILCMVKQTGYVDLVNEGTYLAQIDEKACEAGSDQSSSGSGQSTGSDAKKPMLWTVNSARASNGSDQIVQCWVPNPDHESGGGMIWVRMVVSEGSSAQNPFGVFVLNFAGVPDGGTIDDAMMKGTLRTLDVADGSVGFSFYNEQGDITQPPPVNEHAEVVQANVSMTADLTQGIARIKRQERSNYPPNGDTGIIASEYEIAFDPGHFLRSKDGAPGTCLSRTAFHTSVWRYNLYDSSDGSRIERNSGFGFRTAGGDYGWIGYWGLWVPEGASVSTGDTITQDVYGQSNPPTYTLVMAPGKLIKNTRHTLDLTDIGLETFQWWDFTQPGQPPVQYQVVYRNTTWQEIGVWNPSTNQYDPLPNPITIDVASIHYLGMWSESLGGQVSYVDGDTTITYYGREFVNGSSTLFTGGASQVDLYGYSNCLDAGITTNAAEAGQVFLPPSNDVTVPYHYVFKRDDLTLYYDTDGAGTLVPAGLAPGAVPRSGPFTWGMQSGPMLDSTSGLTDPGQAWSQSIFYTYETGANTWNHYAAVIDEADQFVTFDAPLQFTYVHQDANDRNGSTTYSGHSYLLGYGGAGSLFGIPSAGLDLDGDGNSDRWYPLFSLADGVAMGRNGTEFVVKAIEMEQTLADDSGQCSGLDAGTAGTLVLPDATGYTPPDIGPPPTIDAPPRVIEGVVQGP
jgi:hypothetical protein